MQDCCQHGCQYKNKMVKAVLWGQKALWNYKQSTDFQIHVWVVQQDTLELPQACLNEQIQAGCQNGYNCCPQYFRQNK